MEALLPSGNGSIIKKTPQISVAFFYLVFSLQISQ